MHRVHLDPGLPQGGGEDTARRQLHVVDMVEHLVEADLVGGRVPQEVGMVRDVPAQGPAKGHVQLLEPPADTEDGPTQVEHGPDKVAGHGVPGGVKGSRGIVRRLAVGAGVEVGGAACQQEPIQPARDVGGPHEPGH